MAKDTYQGAYLGSESAREASKIDESAASSMGLGTEGIEIVKRVLGGEKLRSVCCG